MTKQEQRKWIREQKRRLTPELLARADHNLHDTLQNLQRYREAETVLFYASLPDEVPTLQEIERVQKHYVLPCVVGDTDLVLRSYTGSKDLEIQGPYHIPEPTGPLFTDYAAIDLAIIPGMAFDSAGHRLGRGKGYYDRLLGNDVFRQIYKVGLCFDFQFLDCVEHAPHDITMDQVIVIPTK